MKHTNLQSTLTQPERREPTIGPRLSAGGTVFSSSTLPHRWSSETGTQSKNEKPEHRTIKRVKKRKEKKVGEILTQSLLQKLPKNTCATAKTGHDPTMAVKKQNPNVLF